MRKYKMLVLTDHATHSADNSIYDLVRELHRHPRCAHIDVASRANAVNERFFERHETVQPYVSRVESDFAFSPDHRCFVRRLERVRLRSYDCILLRLPPPVPPSFWGFLRRNYWEDHIINRPSGIEETSSKAFLLRFEDICPDMQLCHSVEDILRFREKHPIVLKPLRGYGGQGIVRVEDNQVWRGNEQMSLDEFLSSLHDSDISYLGMEFLPQVDQGDKRVVVVGGKVLGASLRLPPPNSWICNAAQGGRAVGAEVDRDEHHIAERLIPVLRELGIFIFGFDTLVGHDGRRVLSEINTMSIGGISQMARLNHKPLVRETADRIWNYVKSITYGDTPATA